MKKILFCFFSIFSSIIFAQDSTFVTKPKIGLVLSGGGAKGLAHIGVLKVIEKAGVKIDYITGTSMGAIVGGLYASGYNAHQLDSIFSATDFEALIRERIPRSSKNFYEKRNDQRYALVLPFEKYKVKTPTAYSKGLNIYNLLSKLTYDKRNVKDFNQLPIPFLCIATDIETGSQVVLNQGILSNAMLASAAFPSLFYPVVLDGKILVDGGVSNNYPIDELKKMGADIVIGVDVQDDLKSREDLRDATKILLQISNLQMIDKMAIKKQQTDIYIKPDITGFNVISFQAGQEIVKRGEEAGNLVIDQLKKISTNDYFEKDGARITDSLCVSGIKINGLDNYTRSYVVGKLGFKPGQEISFTTFLNGLDNLNATQNYRSILYSFEQTDAGEILALDLEENPTTKYLKLGIHYDELYKTAVMVNVTKKKLFFKNDVFALDLSLGDNFRYYVDYYIDNGLYWSVGFKSRYNTFNRNLDLSSLNLENPYSEQAVNVDFSDLSSKIYLQTLLKHKFTAGGELEFKDLKATSSTIRRDKTLINRDQFLMFNMFLKYDTLDDYYFPSNGVSLDVSYNTQLYSSNSSNNFNDFSIFKFDFNTVKTLFDNFTFQIQVEAGVTIGNNAIPFYDFILGGFGFNRINNFGYFYGYDVLSLHGDSFLKSVFTLDYEFVKKNHLNFTANYATIGKEVFHNNQWLDGYDFSGYSFGYGLESVIGPIQIKHSWSPETAKHFTWLSVGYWF